MIRVNEKIILGRGAFGTVFEGTFKDEKVAVKRIQLTDTSNEKEEDALRKLSHPNVIKLLHVYSDKSFRYFVLELCVASLDKLFVKDENKFHGPMPAKIEVLLQLAAGLDYIHSKKLVHRDLKPENALIWLDPTNQERTSHQKVRVLMKWADFGLSKRVNERGTYTMSGVKGTYDWLAPEILNLIYSKNENQEFDKEMQQRGTVKSDVFAEGLVFSYFVLGGIHPFGSSFEIPQNIRKNKPIKTKMITSKSVKDLIHKMLSPNTGDRITSTQVLDQLNRLNAIRNEKEKQLFNLITEKNTITVGELEGFLKEDVIDISSCVNQEGHTLLIQLLINHQKESNDGKNLMDVINLMIEHKIDVNRQDKKGRNPLHVLAEKGNNFEDRMVIDILKILIKQGINVNCKDEDGWNALHFFCRIYNKENLTEIVRILIDSGIELNCTTEGRNALYFVCESYKKPVLKDIVQLMIENGIDISCESDADEWNALHALCRFYNEDNIIDIICELINHGIDINHKSNEGWNALFNLCNKYHKENLIKVVQLFIDHGIDINCKNNEGWNALLILCNKYNEENLIEIVQLFIKHGIDVNHQNNEGWNALLILCNRYQKDNLIDIVQLFIKHGIDVNHQNNEGWNALLILCNRYLKDNLIDIVQLFISHGIDINCKNNEGWNALFNLCNKYHKDNLIEIVQLLINNGIEITCKKRNGQNALHLICQNHQKLQKSKLLEIIKFFIKQTSCMNCKDKSGKIPFQYLPFELSRSLQVRERM